MIQSSGTLIERNLTMTDESSKKKKVTSEEFSFYKSYIMSSVDNIYLKNVSSLFKKPTSNFTNEEKRNVQMIFQKDRIHPTFASKIKK